MRIFFKTVRFILGLDDIYIANIFIDLFLTILCQQNTM